VLEVSKQAQRTTGRTEAHRTVRVEARSRRHHVGGRAKVAALVMIFVPLTTCPISKLAAFIVTLSRWNPLALGYRIPTSIDMERDVLAWDLAGFR
jgi:hypothetical protein